MTIQSFSTKKPYETELITIDFSEKFAYTTETIASVIWSVSVVSGVDPNPNALLSGAPNNTSTATAQLITGGLDQVTYLISCVANTIFGLAAGPAATQGQVLAEQGSIEVRLNPPSNIISSKQDLADFAIRQLGGGVINVEVSGEQISDAIDNAVQYYHEYHFDGIERDYLVYQIQGTQITVANPAIFQIGTSISAIPVPPPATAPTTSLISNITGNILTINKQLGYNKFTVGQTVCPQGNPSLTTTITAITIGDTDNGYIPAGDPIVGVTKILNITSVLGSADYMFNVQYQIMMAEMQNLVSQGMAYFYGVQNYLGNLDFIMKKEKDFRFNRRMNRLYLDIQWGIDVRAGDIVVAEVYKAVDPEMYPEMYSDIWLRRYVTALIKKQWGNNLRKYQGMQLPGGVTFNGQQIYNEAVEEITTLENECLYSTSPLCFAIG